MKSLITGGETTPLFKTKVLGKHDVQYFRCNETAFIQTEEPYWLEEAYSNAITVLDIGLLSRNLKLRRTAAVFIDQQLGRDGTFLDYGGGYGIFTRLMRDWGFDFHLYDPFCENLFAQHFQISLPPENDISFELVTGWELFEHLPRPLDEIEKMFSLADSILFSTELVPSRTIRSVDDWWYFIPETGQHVSLYTTESLRWIASKFGANLHSDGRSLHLLTKAKDLASPFGGKLRKTWGEMRFHLKRRLRRDEGLLQKDFEMIRAGLNAEQSAGK